MKSREGGLVRHRDPRGGDRRLARAFAMTSLRSVKMTRRSHASAVLLAVDGSRSTRRWSGLAFAAERSPAGGLANDPGRGQTLVRRRQSGRSLFEHCDHAERNVGVDRAAGDALHMHRAPAGAGEVGLASGEEEVWRTDQPQTCICEYGVSYSVGREPCLRAGACICRRRRSRGSLCPEATANDGRVGVEIVTASPTHE
jgi:hypothetical protein